MDVECDEVWSFLSKYGRVVDVCLIRGQNGKSRGCAVVEFEDEAVAARVLKEVNQNVSNVQYHGSLKG